MSIGRYAGDFPAENILQEWSVIFTIQYNIICLFSPFQLIHQSINIEQLAAIPLPRCFIFTKINNLIAGQNC
ncbi:hypothetical protein AM228_00235 [Planktothricoides sp. SR001]|nr:hypothetical protein AM228_00235 [Planktothricoides sp. SR001]